MLEIPACFVISLGLGIISQRFFLSEITICSFNNGELRNVPLDEPTTTDLFQSFLIASLIFHLVGDELSLYAHQQHSDSFPRVKYTRGLQSITAATTDVFRVKTLVHTGGQNKQTNLYGLAISTANLQREQIRNKNREVNAKNKREFKYMCPPLALILNQLVLNK